MFGKNVVQGDDMTVMVDAIRHRLNALERRVEALEYARAAEKRLVSLLESPRCTCGKNLGCTEFDRVSP